jgi:F0F1-type ATP synthase assembly protein I
MTALLIIGVLMMIVGGIWLLVVQFQTSIGWGLGSLVLPIVGLVFVFMHWEVSKKPFLWQVAGIVLAVIAVMNQPAMMANLAH